MKKLVLSLVAIASMVFALPTAVFASSVAVDLTLSKIDPTGNIGGSHKGPVQIPSIALDGHTLYFFTPCDGDTLRLVDEDGVVVYSLVIPDGSSSLELPATLSGDYELQIIRGNFCFWGAVML